MLICCLVPLLLLVHAPRTDAACTTTPSAQSVSGTCTSSALCASAKPAHLSTVRADTNTITTSVPGGKMSVTRASTVQPTALLGPPAPPPPPPTLAPALPTPAPPPTPQFSVSGLTQTVSSPLFCQACFCTDNSTTACTAVAVIGNCVNGYRMAVLGGGFRCLQFAPAAGSGQPLPAVGTSARLEGAFTTIALSGAAGTLAEQKQFETGDYSIDAAGNLLSAGLITQTETLFFVACGVLATRYGLVGTPTTTEVTTAGRGVFTPYQLSIANASLTEGNSGLFRIVFTLTLSPPHPHRVWVNYTTTAEGTATPGVDFTAASLFVMFNANQTTANLSVSTQGDTLYELNETIVVRLSNPVGTRLSNAVAWGTLVNDDALPTLSIADASIVEGNSSTRAMAFLVTQSSASGAITRVNFNIAPGTATNASDYFAQSGVLTFGIGETSKAITVAVVGDTIIESNETVTVTLSGPVGATLLKASAVGTIINDDFPTLSISSPAPVLEGNDGARPTITFVVALSATPSTSVTVRYATAAGTAASAVDFVGASGTLTFAGGTTTLTQSIVVTVIGDNTFEANETLSVALSSATQASIASSTAIGTIANDDALPALAISDVTQAEGNSGTTTFTFTVSMPKSALAAAVNFAAVASGSATANVDFTPVSGTLTFAPGETAKTVDVSVAGDTVAELAENFVVVLSNPTQASIADAIGVGVISNDDASCGVC